MFDNNPNHTSLHLAWGGDGCADCVVVVVVRCRTIEYTHTHTMLANVVLITKTKTKNGIHYLQCDCAPTCVFAEYAPGIIPLAFDTRIHPAVATPKGQPIRYLICVRV